MLLKKHDSIKEINQFLRKKNLDKVFIITGKNSYYKSGAYKIFNKFFFNKKNNFFFKKSNYPDIQELKKIIFLLNKAKPDLIIAIGGGSVLDYAKIASNFRNEKNLNKDIINANYSIKRKFYKLLAIPTTAGSGAEVTANSVIYINKKKYSIEHEKLKPDYFFIIPELIIKSPKMIKASSGFDAISQSLESLISKKSNFKSISYATKSLNLSLENFVDCVKNPSINNTFKMALAANLSGKAISISKTTAPHAVSYPFTSHFNISHGHAVSLTLNEFIKFNYFNLKYSNSTFDLKKRFDLIFKITKVNNILELDNFLKGLKKKVGLEDDFIKLGVKIKKDYSKIISGVNLQRLSNNPIQIEHTTLRSILFSKKSE